MSELRNIDEPFDPYTPEVVIDEIPCPYCAGAGFVEMDDDRGGIYACEECRGNGVIYGPIA